MSDAIADSDPLLLLYGVFRALRARRVPLGVPDYLDAVEALCRGYPWSDVPERLPSRDDLRRLCRMLWTRKDAEARLVDELFDSLPPVSDRYRKELDEAFGPRQESDRHPGEAPAQQKPEAPKAWVGFVSVGQAPGLALPRLEYVSGLGDQTYVLEPETILSSRALAVLWRRFRARVRAGARTELDMEGTLAERCRRGVVAEIVFRAPLVGRAPLVVLADTSPSMGPWMPFLKALADSLELSRLDTVRLLYFSNVPRDLVFATPHLAEVVDLDDLLSRTRGAPVLILSDAGAARGLLSPRRVHASAAFLGRLAKERRRVVWLNPMPRSRWRGTSAGAIADRAFGESFLALDPAGAELIHAVDILRGTKES
jgi:uncharacterized protein with von Willebrand factor type A (vWA) domain